VKPATCNDNLKASISAFRDGKRDFDVQELNDIKLFFLKYKDQLSTTQFFRGELQEYLVISCFADEFQEELLNHMIKKLCAAIAIVVSVKDKEVLIKTNKTVCNVNLCKLSQLLCDGNCIDESKEIAQGKLTEKFLKFTTKLTPCI
jgi:hypothetical protein